jgi:flagellar biosynthetic protein FliR|tara:strand:- start:38 stop:223 length:186 start_codon:yes stop_codon:yes gene_type:complete
MSEPVLHASQYLTSLQAYWWPFCRIVALLSMAPLFNHKAVSVRAAPPMRLQGMRSIDPIFN